MLINNYLHIKYLFIIIEIPSGHIIGTENLVWRAFFNPDTKSLKTREEIEKGKIDCVIIIVHIWGIIAIYNFIFFS